MCPSSPSVSDSALAAFRLHLQQRRPVDAFVPDLTGDTIEIEIIDKQLWKDTKARRIFHVHTSVLDDNGTLLSLASKSGGQNPPYKLTDFSIRRFDLLVEWAYRRRLTVDKAADEDEKEKFEKLGEAFGLGYCIQDMDFQIAVVDEILRLAQELDEFPGYELTDVVYRDSDCEALRPLMVDLWAWKATVRWDAVVDVHCLFNHNDWINDQTMFASDLCNALIRIRPIPGKEVLTTEKKPWEDAEKYYVKVLEQEWGSAGAHYQKNLREEMGEGGYLRFAQLGRNDV